MVWDEGVKAFEWRKARFKLHAFLQNTISIIKEIAKTCNFVKSSCTKRSRDAPGTMTHEVKTLKYTSDKMHLHEM